MDSLLLSALKDGKMIRFDDPVTQDELPNSLYAEQQFLLSALSGDIAANQITDDCFELTYPDGSVVEFYWDEVGRGHYRHAGTQEYYSCAYETYGDLFAVVSCGEVVAVLHRDCFKRS